MRNLQFKDHVEHAIRAIGLQQLHNVGMLEHVTDAGLTLQVWKGNVLTHSTISILILLQLIFLCHYGAI